jgi:hypothetical protein
MPAHADVSTGDIARNSGCAAGYGIYPGTNCHFTSASELPWIVAM